MLFIQSQADRLNISTLVVIFDQPLWYKASEITAEKKLDIVCPLGGFHTHNLDEVLNEIYAENSVLHILSGKAYTGAKRGYILTDSALSNMLIKEVMSSLEPQHKANPKKIFQDFPRGSC